MLRSKSWYKTYIIGLFDQQDIQAEVHAIKVLKYFSLKEIWYVQVYFITVT